MPRLASRGCSTLLLVASLLLIFGCGPRADSTNTVRFFPTGTNYSLGDNDNVSNFATGTLLESQTP